MRKIGKRTKLINWLCWGLMGVAGMAQGEFFPHDHPIHQPGGYGLEIAGPVMNEAVFDGLIERTVYRYRMLAEQEHQSRLRTFKYWNSHVVNATARRLVPTIWQVSIYGGLARHPQMSEDAFVMVICHELGHLLAGQPVYPAKDRIASEGQSDYFATQSCTKVLWRGETERNRAVAAGSSAEVMAICRDRFEGSQHEVNLCARQLTAAKIAANMVRRPDEPEVSFVQADSTQVPATYHRHPRGQCRLQTFVAGALCDKGFDETVIPLTMDEMVNNSCIRSIDGQTGARPLCWFKPPVELE